MTGERIKCPACGENIPGVRVQGDTVFLAYNRDAAGVSFPTGGVRCVCGARVGFVRGLVKEWADAGRPSPKTVQVEGKTNGE